MIIAVTETAAIVKKLIIFDPLATNISLNKKRRPVKNEFTVRKIRRRSANL